MAAKVKNRISEVETNGHAEKPDVAAEVKRITIPKPDFRVVEATIVGTAPYVQNRFGEKARQQIRDKQAEGQTANSRKKREAKDFQAAFKSAHHTTKEGWHGIPANALRSAMIDACRLTGVAMTISKQAVFVLADGIGTDNTPLVRIEGEPEYFEAPVPVGTGMDIRARPLWAEWSAKVRIRYDAGLLRDEDVLNLLMRAGIQVGVGEGRPFSKKSNGQGWGTFEVEGFAEEDD